MSVAAWHMYGKRQAVTDPLGAAEESRRVRDMDTAFVEHLRQAYLRGDFPSVQ